MTILLIESDRLLADNLTQNLKSAGHKINWIVDLQLAIEAIDEKLPEAVIIDLVLAGKSGIEFLYELRSYPEWQNVPVIIWSDLTGEETTRLYDSFRDLGVIAYHRKSTARLGDIARSLSAVTV